MVAWVLEAEGHPGRPALAAPSLRAGVSAGETPETTHICVCFMQLYCLLLKMSFAVIFILSF